MLASNMIMVWVLLNIISFSECSPYSSLKLRHHLSQSHNALSQWAGCVCDDPCKEAGGTTCGVYFKDCCAGECNGAFIKSCDGGDLIDLADLNCENRSSELEGIISNFVAEIEGEIEGNSQDNVEKGEGAGQGDAENGQNSDIGQNSEAEGGKGQKKEESGFSIPDSVKDMLNDQIVSFLTGKD